MFDPLPSALALASLAHRAAAAAKPQFVTPSAHALNPIASPAIPIDPITALLTPPLTPDLSPLPSPPQPAPSTPPSAAPTGPSLLALLDLLALKIAQCEALLVQLQDRKAFARQASAARSGRRGSVPAVEVAGERARWEAIERGLQERAREMRVKVS